MCRIGLKTLRFGVKTIIMKKTQPEDRLLLPMFGFAAIAVVAIFLQAHGECPAYVTLGNFGISMMCNCAREIVIAIKQRI